MDWPLIISLEMILELLHVDWCKVQEKTIIHALWNYISLIGSYLAQISIMAATL